MDGLGSLNAFVQAAKARSFTVAGRQLGVSSSAIGKAVARMEERLGVRLFHRSTRSITLTAEGALFLERCRRIFSEIEAAELELSQTHEAPRGTLRVSLPLVGMLMMPTLVAFMRAYPEIILDLDFSDRVVDVIEEGLRRRGALCRGWRFAFDEPGFGHIPPTPRGGPGLSGDQGCSSDPGRPQGSCLPAPQVSDQQKA
jgi:DNA-binding transcriptional LysR family regulator